MTLVDSIKKRLHRDIVSDPILHARVLNLYLCGEAYPNTVDDYFPIAHVDCPELARKMRTHKYQEDKHVSLYAHAIQKLGAEVQELPGWCIFNHVIRAHTPQPWRICGGLDPDVKRDKVANFLAHAHYLEKRVARSLEYHIDACAQAGSRDAERAVGIVLADEHDHVSYTREAVFELVSSQRAHDILEEHRRAEWHANLDFSCGQLRRLLIEESGRWPRSRTWIYQTSAFVMKEVLACA